MPEQVRRAIGYALRFAQAGVKAKNVKPLKGFAGAGVLEVIEDFDGNTYRAVYTVRLAVHYLCTALLSEEIDHRNFYPEENDGASCKAPSRCRQHSPTEERKT
jgi:hypothetical protein